VINGKWTVAFIVARAGGQRERTPGGGGVLSRTDRGAAAPRV
jgi:hypothetical protein